MARTRCGIRHAHGACTAEGERMHLEIRGGAHDGDVACFPREDWPFEGGKPVALAGDAGAYVSRFGFSDTRTIRQGLWVEALD